MCSCASTSYLLEQAKGQVSLLSKREKIKEVLKNDKTPDNVKKKLELVLDVREFVSKQLDLEVEDNYSTYVDVGRSWVVKTLTASDKCSISPYHWKFPIVGRVPYLGFFNEMSAEKKKREFESRGFDTYLRDVSAYSTLGWFSDPVLSSFLKYRDFIIIGTIIHETVHMNIFKKGDMKFNENLATFIEEVGTEIFIKERYGKASEMYKDYLKYLSRVKKRIEFLKKVLKDLKAFYGSGLSCDEIKNRRQGKFDVIEEKYRTNYGRKIKVNNAYFVNIALYNIDQEKLYKEYREKFNKNLRAFIAHYRKMIR